MVPDTKPSRVKASLGIVSELPDVHGNNSEASLGKAYPGFVSDLFGGSQGMLLPRYDWVCGLVCV